MNYVVNKEFYIQYNHKYNERVFLWWPTVFVFLTIFENNPVWWFWKTWKNYYLSNTFYHLPPPSKTHNTIPPNQPLPDLTDRLAGCSLAPHSRTTAATKTRPAALLLPLLPSPDLNENFNR